MEYKERAFERIVVLPVLPDLTLRKNSHLLKLKAVKKKNNKATEIDFQKLFPYHY